jgi:hypothetical protein
MPTLPPACPPASAGCGISVQTAMPAMTAALFLQAAPRAADDAPELGPGVKGPPKLPWRVAAALTYLIPWIDSLTLGKEIYHAFPSTILLYFIPGRLSTDDTQHYLASAAM